jgi:outer membrane protein OmpA-like peptidoglycan-associated protein/opacity protein-like surface antigen
MNGIDVVKSRWPGIVALAATLGAGPVQAQEEAIEAKWYTSVGLGMIQYEGDEELEDGFLGTVRIGYDFNEWWAIEAALAVAPHLKESHRFDVPTQTRVSRLRESAGVSSTYAFSLAGDALFHFTRFERFDPYLSLGVGVVVYADEIGGETFDPSTRVGGGVMYHFNDRWAVRGDFRAFLAGRDTEANAIVDGGVVWTWGAGVPRDIKVIAGPMDSDGDRLSDIREVEIGTNPYDPDTDKDGLSDGEEVLDYGTNPLERDTDYDYLTDGEEVKVYGTNPLQRDTDGGGVCDGHEVLEDLTDPLVGADDLQLFELYIQFEYDKAIIDPRHFGELDIVGKVLARDPAATATVEGHADRKKLSDAEYNLALSQRRAAAVVDYLVTKRDIDRGRLTAKGFGFSRPKAPNDPAVGNPVNRRVEVYIRRTEQSKAEDAALETPVPVAAVETPAPVAAAADNGTVDVVAADK